MTRPRLLMVGGWDELYAKTVDAGADLVVLHAADKVPEARAGLHTEAYPVDIRDVATCVALAAELHQVQPFDAVVSFTEWGLESAAAIGERLRLRTNPPGPVRLTRDKLAMRKCLADSGMDGVAFRQCRTPADVAAYAREAAGPFILKPVAGAGSAGVTLVTTTAELPGAWRRASIDGPAIAEAYVEGPEFSIDTMSYDGEHHVVAIAEKVTTGPPGFVELGHQVPARLPAETADAIAVDTRRFLDLIGQRHGPAHTEFKLAGRRMVIIESQTRTGGDQIWELNRLATGFDAHRATVEHLLWGTCRPAPRRRAAAAVRFFTAPPGRVVAIEGAEQAVAHPGVTRFLLSAAPGMVVGPLSSSQARLGYVVAVGESVDDAAERAETARSCVSIRTAGPVS